MSKFKKGDIVICKKFRVFERFVADKNGVHIENCIDTYHFNRKAVITGSWRELLIGRGVENPKDKEEYEITFLDDRSTLAWVADEDLVIAEMSLKEAFNTTHPNIQKLKEERGENAKDYTSAALQFRAALLSDKALYNAFLASIESALKEIPIGTGLYDVAKVVADRIIGEEEIMGKPKI